MTAQIKRFGGSTPKRVLEAPTIPSSLEWVLEAFYALDSERNASDNERIPWSKTVMYAEYNELSSDEKEELLFFADKLDNAYLKHLLDRQKREHDKLTRASPAFRRRG